MSGRNKTRQQHIAAAKAVCDRMDTKDPTPEDIERRKRFLTMGWTEADWEAHRVGGKSTPVELPVVRRSNDFSLGNLD